MSAPESFQGPLAELLRDFVAFKHMQGWDYTPSAKILRQFDRFLCGRELPDGHLRLEDFREYLCSKANLAPRTRADHLSTLRQFSRYAHARDPGHAVAVASLLPRTRRSVRFCRIAKAQVEQLRDAALALKPPGSARSHSMCFLIGFLYCTGLRISEALSLNLADVDFDVGTVFVRKGKFSKERIVALDSSTVAAVHGYLEVRGRFASDARGAPLLVGGLNRRLTYNQAYEAFRALCQRCGVSGPSPPRLHDLRHNYACACLERWRAQGEDVHALLPILAAAMGHVEICHTQVYIHTREAALQDAVEAFRAYARSEQENML